MVRSLASRDGGVTGDQTELEGLHEQLCKQEEPLVTGNHEMMLAVVGDHYCATETHTWKAAIIVHCTRPLEWYHIQMVSGVHWP